MGNNESRPSPDRAQRYEAVFNACHLRVLGYVIRRTDDRAAAEDIVSETFLIAWRRLDKVPAEDPLPWLLKGTLIADGSRYLVAFRRDDDQAR